MRRLSVLPADLLGQVSARTSGKKRNRLESVRRNGNNTFDLSPFVFLYYKCNADELRL